MALYIRQNRICFGVSLRSISKHTLDFSLNYFDEFKFFSLKRLKIDGFHNEKSKKVLERRPSKIKFAAEISRKSIIKSISFVKKEQDFSAAKTSYSSVEVNVFYEDTSPLDNKS